MDLAVYARVLWRFRFLVVLGTILSVVIAGLSVYRVQTTDGIHLSHRDPEIWQAQTTLLLTQRGFPEGRLSYGSINTQTVVDPGRLSYLSGLYAQLANGDEVQRMAFQAAPGVGGMNAVAVGDGDPREGLPLIDIFGSSTSPAAAERIARNGARILTQYISERQQSVDIPARDRVVIKTLSQSTATVLVPRKKTTAVFLLLAGLTATLGLVLVLENVRPRARIAPVPADAAIETERDRAISA